MESVKNRIHIGKAELLKSDGELDFTFDAPMSPIKEDDGRYSFITVDLGADKYFHRFVGTADSPLDIHEYFEFDYNGHAEFWPCGIWIMSVYKYEDGTLVGFCHREIIHKTDPHFPMTYYMGLAVSHDNGKSWKYVGDFASNAANYHVDFHANMGGCPLLVRDGYFYVFFNDFDENRKKRITSARMSVKETYDAVTAGRIPEVFKYSGCGVWDTDPWNGTGAPAISCDEYGLDAHSKGVYCKALDRYLVTLQTGGAGKLVMFISEDCEHFDEYVVVDSNDKAFMQPYSFFMSSDGDCSDDMNTVGREFYVYFPRKDTGRNGLGYDYDEFYRSKITIE